MREGGGDVDWIHLAYHRNRLRALVISVMGLHNSLGIFKLAEWLPASQEDSAPWSSLYSFPPPLPGFPTGLKRPNVTTKYCPYRTVFRSGSEKFMDSYGNGISLWSVIISRKTRRLIPEPCFCDRCVVICLRLYIRISISNILNVVRSASPLMFVLLPYFLCQRLLTFWLLRTPTESLLEAADP
jgi:hypothetical protein